MGPATADASSQSDHGNLSVCQCSTADVDQRRRLAGIWIDEIQDICFLYITYLSGRRKPVLCQADPTGLEIRTNLLVLNTVESQFVQQRRQVTSAVHLVT